MTEPYYQDGRVTLYHGDCREITEWLDADVLVTDPPYGRAWRQGDIRGHVNNVVSKQGIANDSDTAVRDALLALWGDKPAIVFGDLMLAPPERTKLVGVYRKPADSGIRGAIGGVRRDLEAIYWLGKWGSGIGGRSSLFATALSLVGGSSGIVAKSGSHPHAKALDVAEELVAMTPKDAVIADPCAGSGPFLVAARNLGRPAIGVELEERYCEVIAKRLAQDCLPLFNGEAS